MKEEFTVLYDRIPVGKIESIRQGLYYRISCRYKLPCAEICRLIVRWPGGWENIGIPIPEGEGFYLVKKIPVKKIQGEHISFHLISSGTDPDDPEQAEHTEEGSPSVKEATDIMDPGVASDEENSFQERCRISDVEPFEDIDRLWDSRLETVDGQDFAVFEDRISEIELETDGTMVGTEDIGIDGNTDDVIFDPV